MPPRHVAPSQQPVQHWPSLQVPPVHGVPLAAGALVHAPDWQLSRVQLKLSSQVLQGVPSLPHLSELLPGWQPLPSQQPVQQLPP